MFKYASVEINMTLDLRRWQRQTYSILDWLGDLGGLYDSLFILCRFLISPIASYTLQQAFFSKMFRVIESQSQ